MTGEYDESTERTPLPNDPPQPSLARMVLALGGIVAGIGLDPTARNADLAEVRRLREKLEEQEERARLPRKPVPTPMQFRHESTPKQPRPDGADERDLRAAEEKRARKAERRRAMAKSRERGIVCAAGGNWCCDAAVCLCGSER